VAEPIAKDVFGASTRGITFIDPLRTVEGAEEVLKGLTEVPTETIEVSTEDAITRVHLGCKKDEG
jgi:hypothetical protein